MKTKRGQENNRKTENKFNDNNIRSKKTHKNESEMTTFRYKISFNDTITKYYKNPRKIKYEVSLYKLFKMERIKRTRTKYKSVNKEPIEAIIKDSNSSKTLSLVEKPSNKKLEHKNNRNSFENKDSSSFSNNSYKAAHWMVLSYLFAVFSLFSKEQGYCSLFVCIALDIVRSSNLKFESIIRVIAKVSEIYKRNI